MPEILPNSQSWKRATKDSFNEKIVMHLLFEDEFVHAVVSQIDPDIWQVNWNLMIMGRPCRAADHKFLWSIDSLEIWLLLIVIILWWYSPNIERESAILAVFNSWIVQWLHYCNEKHWCDCRHMWHAWHNSSPTLWQYGSIGSTADSVDLRQITAETNMWYINSICDPIPL